MRKIISELNLFSYENKLLLLLFCVFGCVFVDRLSLSFLFPMMSDELNLTNAHLGMLSAILALCWALSGAGLGAISDRFNIRKPMLVICVAMFSLFSGLSGIVSSFALLLIFRALMGIAEGPVLPISQSLMLEVSQVTRRGLNMGLVQATAPGLLGAIIAPPLIIMIALDYGWRNAFYITVLPGLVLAFLIYKLLKINSTNNVSINMQEGVSEESKKEIEKVSYKEICKNKNVILCIFISCFFVTWFILIVTFTPTFLVKERGFSEKSMGLIVSAIGFAWVFWGTVIPAISDRLGRKPILIFFSLIAVSCPLFLCYISNPFLLGIIVFLTYTGMGCFTLFMATIPSETVSRTMIASTLGLIMGIGEFIGGFVAPFAAGFIADNYGLASPLLIASLGALLSCILAYFLKETAPLVIAKRTQFKSMPITGE